MTYSDPYHLTTTRTPEPPAPGATRADVLRVLLWALLVISAVGNTVASYAAASTQVHLALGAVTALCVAALVAQRLRGRR
ncbi:hypothetical protein [Streptomyces sp. NPDC020951]|uniref:hypothetical protein n=1 Tax=Streptomyces sp. NPDC020951 TaxID=3365104 RepID=UPI0037897EED